ncbi:MAG: RtcB family protein [Planctomycetes bacterium]|nr:RtcB family protein [Planctomycetota bacterium]
MSAESKGYWRNRIEAIDEAVSQLNVGESVSAITVIGTERIRETFDDVCLQQAVNSRLAPGVSEVVLNPDAHLGYGAPVGCVLVSPSHIYPGPVGVDIKCSMSLLQTDLPEEELTAPPVRRRLIEAICDRTPTGMGRGSRHVAKARQIKADLGRAACVQGASEEVLTALGIPAHWSSRCEDAFHVGADGTRESLADRLDELVSTDRVNKFAEKCTQLGSYGGGNHFGECEVVRVAKDPRHKAIAERFGLRDGRVAFLSHCGSRGIGHRLASNQFQTMQDEFRKNNIPFPGNDRELVYAELGSHEANAYIADMSIGANFATVNHMLINALVLEAFQEVFPGVKGELVYFISHNIARREFVKGQWQWVHRKGATRAFPAGHPELASTPYADTGHPILLPGNPRDGSAVMVAEAGAEKSCFSINHGAGRILGRRAAFRTLDQKTVDKELRDLDIMSNCRQYPLDEAPSAYKNFREVLRSVELAGLASEVARLDARFVIKDGGPADD